MRMVSLIVATLNRVEELERLLASLDAQTFEDFEVIVVDQNSHDRLVPVLKRHPALAIRHLRCELGVSRARNAGLRIATGDIIAVPDDDCWYPAQLLATVTEWFNLHPEFDALLTGARNADNKLMAPKWAPGPGRCTKKNIWHCAAGAFTGFLRRRVVTTVGFFDEEIGPGTPSKYQSGEDIDYFIRPLECGFAIWYEPSLTVHHPEMQSVDRLRKRVHGYALGVGYLLRVHGYSPWYLSKIVGRSLAGAVLNFFRGDIKRGRIYLERAAGQFEGYVFCPRDHKRLLVPSNR